jgi:hypothetical protein
MHCRIAVLFASILCLANCSPKTSTPSETTTSEGQQYEAPAGKTAARDATALIRFMNADPKGSKDIQVSDMPIISDVAYRSITPFQEIKPGVTQFKLHEGGGKDSLATSQQELFFGQHYTLIALPKGNHMSRLAIMTDNLAAVDPGKARVRLINATPDVNDLDLYLAGTKMRIQHGVDASMETSFTDVNPGILEIHPVNGPTAPQLSNLAIEANRLYTFVVVGNSSALDVVRIEDRIRR